MFKDNLITLRKMHHLSQEELAERLEISRQTLSKYETGESIPDIDKCKKIAEVFDVSLDELVNYNKEANGGLGVPPRGKHMFGMVKVGDKGQIVIPVKARKVFHIQAGDSLFVLGDEERGLALITEKEFMKLVGRIRESNGGSQ